jgi:CDP-glucose 4,6-dehydratase
MEKMVALVTGHSGFCGKRLCKMLEARNYIPMGYSLDNYDDIRDFPRLLSVIKRVSPTHIFHLAAQPLVTYSYDNPLYTFETNVIGTANLLEAATYVNPISIVIVTTDKCYRESDKLHIEDDPLGGYDPYSASKACAEIVAASYRDSYGLNIATARAGNLIGGGDWSKDRIIPDCIRHLMNQMPIQLKNPAATRPFQYVEDALEGYILLAEHETTGAFNFGPDESHSVKEIVELVIDEWGSGTWYSSHPSLHESACLMLDSTKAKNLGWSPRYDFESAVRKTVQEYKELLK